jgi:hypothetical protein
VDALLESLAEALRRDEHVLALRPAVERFNEGGLRLLTESAKVMEEAQRRREAEREREREVERQRVRTLEAELERRRAVQERERGEPHRPEVGDTDAVLTPHAGPEGEPTPPTTSKTIAVAGSEVDAALDRIREDAAANADATVEITWRILRGTGA